MGTVYTILTTYLQSNARVVLPSWLSRDPIGEFGDNRNSDEQLVDLNLYAMLHNGSVNASDYLGLKPNCCPNPSPVDATVASHDAVGASRGDKIPRNANVAQLLGHFANDIKAAECLRRLNISAHGNSSVIAIGGNDGDASSPPYDPRGRVNRDISVEASNALRIGQRIKNLVCRCKPCEIYLLSCHVGLGRTRQALASGTGCAVYAPNGFCCPNYKNPNKAKIKPNDPRYGTTILPDLATALLSSVLNKNMRKTIFILGRTLLILVAQACKHPPADVINKALASTNVLFQPNLQEPITLSRPATERLKRIIERFNQRSVVRVENDILPYESGRFILGDARFGWLGRMLYIYDPKTKRYYVVEDASLGEMAKAFFQVQGQPPLKNPSQEQWKEILSVLEKVR